MSPALIHQSAWLCFPRVMLASETAAAASTPSPPTGGASSSLRTALRKKICETLGDLGSDTADAIESELFARYAGKEYSTKGRSIAFNLSKNRELRQRVLSGEMSAAALVTARVSDLATDALQIARQASLDRFVAQVGARAHSYFPVALCCCTVSWHELLHSRGPARIDA